MPFERTPENEAKHGTRARYNGSGYPGTHPCRCKECKEANAVYQRQWRQRTGKTPGGREPRRKGTE